MIQLTKVKSRLRMCLLTILFTLISFTFMMTPAFADAKRGTVVTVEGLINNVDDYGSFFRCVTGDYKPLLQDPDSCEIDEGEHMNVKVFTKDLRGLPKKEMIYQITAHNNNSSYICVDKGAIERGYADTVDEIVLSETDKIEDVCTTVNGAGDTKTKALFTVEERGDGIYIVFKNTGRDDWKGYKPEYPYSTERKVDFSKIP